MSDTLSLIIEAVNQLDKKDFEALKAHLQTVESGEILEGLTPMQIHELEVTKSEHTCCPRCLSFNIIGWGPYKDRRRFMCHNCHRTFNELTGTVWHYLHSHDKFKQFILCMAQQKSIRASAEEVDVCESTAFFWRHKLLNALYNIKQNQLKEEIEADETYILESNKGQKDIVAQYGRKPRKRGGKASKRGISNEQVCILVATDNQNNTVFEIAGKGRLTQKAVFQILGNKIRKQRINRAIFVTDKHPSYLEFVEQKKLIHQRVDAKKKEFVNDGGFSISRVNAIHSRLKRWLTKFNGVATKYLQNYLHYFRLWDKVKSFKERFHNFLQFSVQDNQAFIRVCDIR